MNMILRRQTNIVQPQRESLKEMLRYSPKIDCSQRLDSMRFVVFDTEATGLKPHRGDRAISLGAVVVENGRVDDNKTFYELIDPQRSIPKKISSLTGITDEMVADSPDLTHVLSRFIPWAGKSVLVGHAVQFDVSLLNNHLTRHHNTKLGHQTLDTRQLASFSFPGLHNYSLEELCACLDITCPHRHHALWDALATAHLLAVIIDHLSRHNVHTFGELQNFIRYHKFMSPVLCPSL